MYKQGKIRILVLLTGLALVLVFVTKSSSPVNAIQPPVSPPVDPAAPFTPKVLSLLPALTIDEKISLVHGNGFDVANFAAIDPQPLGEVGMLLGVDRLGIPPRRDADAIGINVYADATAAPTRLGIAASFDPTAAARLGQLEGADGRALGVDLIYGPQMEVDPLANLDGANTSFGEDPFLTGRLAIQEVNGIQSQGLMSEPKKLTVSNIQNAGPAAFGPSTPSVVDDQTAHEMYLSPFEAVVLSSQPSSLMCSYVDLQITPLMSGPDFGCQNDLLLNTLLRGQWGFPGFVLSDYGATHSTSILQGLDQDFPGPTPAFPPFEPGYFDQLLKPLVDPASPTYDPAYAAALDQSVARVLYQMERFGLLACASPTGPVPGCTLPDRPALNTTADQVTAEQLAEETAVLLKNDGNLLPLGTNDLKRGIAVIGPTANLLPGSPGADAERSRGFADRNMISPLDALQTMTPAGSVITYAPGVDRIGTVIPASAVPSGWARQQNGTPVGTDATLDFGPSNPLTPGIVYTWDGTINVPTDGTYALWLQSSAGSMLDGGQVNPRTGNPNPLGGGLTALSVDGTSVKLAIPSTIQANTYPGGNTVNGIYLGWSNWGAYLHLTAGAHTVRVSDTVPQNAVVPVLFRFTWSSVQETINAAVSLAQKASLAIVFVDDANASSAPGAVNPLGPYQDQLVAAVTAVNPRTVVVLNTGNPVLMPWLSSVKALLEMWYPGQEGGTATAKILLGQANPGGRLPITFPASSNDTPFTGHPERLPGVNGQITWSEGIFTGYRWYDQQNIQPQFEFGYGLSYTQFRYSKLSISQASDGGLDVGFRVQNVGNLAGDEVPQVYLGAPSSPPPGVQFAVNQLVMFTRITLAPGQWQDVSLHVAPLQLSYWSTDQQAWVQAAGSRTLSIGASSRDIRLQGQVTEP
jgi:beta-glucosidase